MKTIGMDIGTTTVCAVLTDAETGELLDAKTLTNDAHLKSERSWERIQNPTRILELCRQLLADYLGSSGKNQRTGRNDGAWAYPVWGRRDWNAGIGISGRSK